MYACIRRYPSEPDSAAILNFVRNSNIAEVIAAIPGFKGYYLVDAGDGVVASVSVFESKAGADRSSAVAAEWLTANLPQSLRRGVPEITQGEVVLKA